MKSLSAVRMEGGFFSPDLFDQILAGEVVGQKPRDFGISRRSLTDEIAAVFAEATALWNAFYHRLERLEGESLATTETRTLWVLPLLNLLGYELEYNRSAYQIGGMRFAISHRAGTAETAPPVHIVGARQPLGRRPQHAKSQLSPHSLLQEYLNRSEALFGLVTNGLTLRLLRNTTYIRRQCYVEFDLEAIFTQRLFTDFALFFRLLHRSRLPHSAEQAHQCLLEQYYQISLEQGGRVRDRLRDGVEKALEIFANGFLTHPRNEALRQKLRQNLSPQDFYQQLLRLVYRILFLLVAEERKLLSSLPLYREHYSLRRFRRLVDRRAAYTDDVDLYHSLRILWKLLGDPSLKAPSGKPLASLLGLPVLNGRLFEPLLLDNCRLTNRHLLSALWHLLYYHESPTAPPRRVNYGALDVEELGSVYESLLDYTPQLLWQGPYPQFQLAPGSERKSTGSYYTPRELVGQLIHSALEPVIEQCLKKAATPEEKEQSLLSLKVVDPACGSGHFLLAAARRLGRELASVRTGEMEPSPDEVRQATRDVIAHCIYGVDKNPLAVELCQLALWLEAHVPGKPLTFLDHRIRCGDSLLGVLHLEVLKKGIPDKAFTPTSLDDKALARQFQKENRAQRKEGQLTLFEEFLEKSLSSLSEEFHKLEQIPDDSVEQIEAKKRKLESLERERARQKMACHLWCAAFFQWFSKENQEKIITTAVLRSYLEGGSCAVLPKSYALELAHRHSFFHYPLEFPEVFQQGGFHVVLGNPPWERIKLQEKEFFATQNPEIARAPNKAARRKLIEQLPETDPELYRQYQKALHTIESTARFLRHSGSYPHTGRGDINTYSVFAERMVALLREGGRAGLILPTGIATDDTNKYFFQHLVEQGQLVSLFDFENRDAIFPHIHRSYKFCLLTLQKGASSKSPMEFAFFCTQTSHLEDRRRRFTLTPEELTRLNPNTKTLPIFRTVQDAELTKAIYRRVPVLLHKESGENPWGVRFATLFHMSNDSHLFCTARELEKKGFRLVGNRYVKGDEIWLPLYEAKMIWLYDHRFGTFLGVKSRSNTHLPTPCDEDHQNPAFLAMPWYWVRKEEVEARLSGKWEHFWLLGFRDVTNATNERTAIFSLLPWAGVGGTINLVFPTGQNSPLLLSNFSSLIFDFLVRQKVGGIHLTLFTFKQLPVLPPGAYGEEDLLFLVPRVLELVYTAWDTKPFADEVWRVSDPALQKAIARQWEENASVTGGNAWQVPEWASAYPEIAWEKAEGIPHPPFRWDRERRALLQAELDAYYAHFYGLSRKQLRYILDPADLTEGELRDILDPEEEVEDPLEPEGYQKRVARSDFPGETFRVLKEKELRTYGEYRTRRLILSAWQRLFGKKPFK